MDAQADQSKMNARERALLGAELGGRSPRLVLRSRTFVDTGRWWRRTPLWLCVTDDSLVLLAASRRCYAERIDLADCTESYYCHATGQLVIVPGEQARFNQVTLLPQQALDVLDLIEAGDGLLEIQDNTATENSRA